MIFKNTENVNVQVICFECVSMFVKGDTWALRFCKCLKTFYTNLEKR